MLVVLHTESRHGRAQRIQLRSNQMATFGRSEWADYSFTNDRVMADMHFEVRCVAEGCRVRNLSETVTLINGKETDGPTFVFDGDEIQAGTTILGVTIEGAAQRSPDPEPEDESEEEPSTVAAVAPVALSLVATCSYLELAKDVRQLADTTESHDELIQSLANQEQFLDALRIRAYLLPKRDAVWWGCASVTDELDGQLEPEQEKALQAALAWVTDPTEELRREAENASNDVRNQGPGGMLALSAFWSEGSLGPPEAPHVPADERLVCQGVSAALITAAYIGNADLATERLHAFVAKGKLVADGELPPPNSGTAD